MSAPKVNHMRQFLFLHTAQFRVVRLLATNPLEPYDELSFASPHFFNRFKVWELRLKFSFLVANLTKGNLRKAASFSSVG